MLNIVTAFDGLIAFLIVLLIGIPVKKLNYRLAGEPDEDDDVGIKRYKRLNLVLFFLTFVVGVVLFYVTLPYSGEDHFKLCCAVKAGSIAVAMQALYDQIR